MAKTKCPFVPRYVLLLAAGQQSFHRYTESIEDVLARLETVTTSLTRRQTLRAQILGWAAGGPEMLDEARRPGDHLWLDRASLLTPEELQNPLGFPDPCALILVVDGPRQMARLTVLRRTVEEGGFGYGPSHLTKDAQQTEEKSTHDPGA